MDEVKEKVHYLTVTGIIRNSEGKYLIVKRSENEKAFPGRWCVPGGKVVRADFESREKDTSDHWLDVIENVLKREIKEETDLDIEDIGYVSNLVFIRPNGFSTFILSMHGKHKSGEVKLNQEELVDFAWINLDEAKNYDLIENIYEQIEKVDKMYSEGNL